MNMNLLDEKKTNLFYEFLSEFYDMTYITENNYAEGEGGNVIEIFTKNVQARKVCIVVDVLF